jgi:hypothetical protein
VHAFSFEKDPGKKNKKWKKEKNIAIGKKIFRHDPTHTNLSLEKNQKFSQETVNDLKGNKC